MSAGTDVLILAYHRVNREVRDGLSIAPATLQSELTYLLDRGWRPTVLDDHLDDLESARGQKIFAITFDDGYQDNYLHAAPVLEDLGLKATVYLVSSFIDTDTPFPWVEPYGPAGGFDAEDLHMTTEQLEDAMSRRIFNYGSHTMTHPRLSTLSRDQATEEIAGSKAALERRLGIPIRTFCYPAGDFDADTAGLVAEAGYEAAVVTPNRAIPESDFTLHRVGIYSHITPRLFRLKVSMPMRAAATSPLYWRSRRAVSKGMRLIRRPAGFPQEGGSR